MFQKHQEENEKIFMGIFDSLFSSSPRERMMSEARELADKVGRQFSRSDSYAKAVLYNFKFFYTNCVKLIKRLETEYDDDSVTHIKKYIRNDISSIQDALLAFVFLKNDIKYKTGKDEFNKFVEHGFMVADYIEDKYYVNKKFISKMWDIDVDGDILDLIDYKDSIYFSIFNDERPKKPDITLYGVSFSDSYDSVISKGLKRGYTVKASYISDKYRDVVIKIDNNDYSSLKFINGNDNIPGLSESYVNTFYRVKYLLKSKVDNYGYDTIIYEVDTDNGTNNINFCFCNMGDNNKVLVAISFDYDKNIYEVYDTKYGRCMKRNFSFCNEDDMCKVYQSNNTYALLSKGKCFLYKSDIIDSLSLFLMSTHNKIKEQEKKDNERRKSEI